MTDITPCGASEDGKFGEGALIPSETSVLLRNLNEGV